MWYFRKMYIPAVVFLLIVTTLSIWFYNSLSRGPVDDTPVLNILSYPNFTKAWGPGPEIAQRFEKIYGVRIRWIEATNAGMLTDYLSNTNSSAPPDVVLGLDVLSLEKAEKVIEWKDITLGKVSLVKDILHVQKNKKFIPFDWSPMTFIYKRKNNLPPKQLVDLTEPAYLNSLALQDPASSGTGMYFLIWVLSVMGEDRGFEYLESLKPSVRVISPSWSASYSLFKNDQAPYVFSYFTSPLYHHIQEKDFSYQPIYFDDPHVYSVEFAGVPASCTQCDLGIKFVLFLLEPENQKWIMEKNFMLPVVSGVKKNTEFDFPQSIRLIDPETYQNLLNKKIELLERWKALQL
jgi:thiamine transport system substrate-binding protein